MDIKSLRHATELSQREFSDRFGIPLGTLRNWEQGISKPPEYVYSMIAAQTRRNLMINIETIYFLKLVEDLAKMSKNGIEPFANATQLNINEKIFYDENKETQNGEYPVVCDACVIDGDCDHHDIISYHGSTADEYSVCAKQDENGKWFVLISLYDDSQIIIEDGEWYFV